MEKAEEEICNGNYAGALEIYERLISSCEEAGEGPIPQGLLLGKANCFALAGHFRDSLENLLEAFQSHDVHPAQLHTFVKALVEFTRASTARREPGVKDVALRCVSCSGVPVDPVTITCGHTQCKACAEKMDFCGGCKERISHATASSCKVDVVLQGFLQKHFTQELEASHLRLLGNELFKKKDTEGALGKYQQAFLMCPSDHLVQGNLSHVLCLHGKFDQSLERAESACQLQPEWAKGYYRKACALIGLGQKGDAVVAFAQCMARQMPENTNVRDALVKVLHELLSSVAQRKRISDSESTTGKPKEYEELLDLIRGVQRDKGQEQNLNSGVPLLERLKANNHDVCTDSFECSLCCRLFYEPVTTPCGHTFCRTCLNRNLDHRPYCPICRFLLDQYLAERKQSVTLAIDIAIQELFPVEYLERKQHHEHEMEQLASVALDTDVEIPVFVCAVAWPRMPCPLHVFEPRYRLMIRQCMESGSRQFGMCVPCDENRGLAIVSSFADYGVMLEIQEIQYLPDGRSYVDTVGGRRFKVLHRGMRDGYHTAKVVWIKDDPVPADEIESVAELHSRAHQEAQQWFDSFPMCVKRRITPITGEMPPLERDPLTLPQGPAWVWWIAAICPISTDKQLSILATTSLKVRIPKLQQILASFPHF